MDPVLVNSLVKLAYVVAAVLFIFGLKQMGHPRTAVRGNLLGATGMALAIVVTLLNRGAISSYSLIAIGIVIGAAIGAVFAVKIQMTAMPQMVALFNGFGGGASIFVAGAELLNLKGEVEAGAITGISGDVLIATAASGIIGAVTFWGSLVAFGKLQELKFFWNPHTFPGQQLVSGALGAARHFAGRLDGRRGNGWIDAGHGWTMLADVPRLGRHRLGAWVHAHRSDRRGRHAGRHRPLELAIPAGRRGDGFRDRQQRADHRRFARRRLGHHSHATDVQGDEPFADERAVRRHGRASGSSDRRADTDELYATVRSTSATTWP
jgi:hypothetical protein